MIAVFSIKAAAFEVEIGSEVEISREKITLGEIAEIKAGGLTAVKLEELKNLSFKKSPAPGYKKRLTKVLVDLSIKNLGYQQNQYNLKMPQTVIVKRKSTIIKKEEIAEIVREYLNKKLNFSKEKFRLEAAASGRDLEIPAGEYEIKISDQQKINFPNTNLKLEIWQRDKKIRQRFYPIKIILFLDVLTAARNLTANSRIRKTDFKVEKKEIVGNPEKLISDFSELDFNNLALSHSLKKGDILNSNDLRQPIAVKWGQKLHLKVNIDKINISTFVEAKERGKIGDIITVENINSGYQFQVKVISANEVRLLTD